MSVAFPSLSGEERERLARVGVNPDASLLRLLVDLTGGPQAVRLMRAEAEASARARVECPLSDRELEVLILYAQGHSVTTAARSLHVSPHTVNSHMRKIRCKLGARTIAHAVHIAHHDRLL